MIEPQENKPSLNEGAKESFPKKKSRLGNIKNAVNKAIAEVGIAGSLLGGTVTPEVASTALIPETAATITAMAPTTGAAVKTIALGTAAALASACDRPDITPPTIDAKTSIDIQGGEQVRVSGNQLYIGSNMVASWSDDVSSNCMVSVTTNGNNILGSSINDTLTINVKVTDEAGNSNSASIKVNVLNNAPVITAKSSVNIFGGEKIDISNNKLLLGDEEIASRSDDKTQNCTVSVKFNGKEVKSGDTINPTGENDKISITVTDNKGKYDRKEINVTNDTIKGLETLKNLNMQVDQEIDLLKGISFADGIELVKVEVEIDGQRYQVDNPHKYTPEYPGECNIIFTIKGKTGEIKEVRSDTLTIKALEYISPNLETADIINNQYKWYNILMPAKKQFVLPHILTSYITGERYKHNNMEYIIIGEIPNNYDCEDVGPNGTTGDSHGDGGYRHIKNMSPFSTIKASGGSRDYVINYINSHPEKFFMLSCASDALGGDTLEELKTKGSSMYKALTELLEKENVIICVAGFNYEENIAKTLNENEKAQEKGSYKSASINSSKNNKVTIVGYNPAGNNIFRDDHQSAMPIGFGQGNIVIPFVERPKENSVIDFGTSTSSRPTAAHSSTLGNHLSIIMHNHQGTTLEDANTIMQEKYLCQETFKYKDEDGTIKNGGTRHFFNTDKFIDEELLHKSEIENVILSGENIQLPSGRGICYVGKGIQFEYKGRKYSFTKENKSKFMDIVANNDIKRYWSKELWINQGGKSNVEIDVYILDTQGKKVPDIQLHIIKPMNQ